MEDIIQGILVNAKRDRSALIPMLQRVQGKFGYVPREAVEAISRHLRVPACEIFGVLTFYAQFRLKPAGKHSIKACRGTACHVRGASAIISTVEDELNLHGAEDTTPDGEFTFEKIACFGACSLAPVIVLDAETSGRMTPDKTRELIHQAQDRSKEQVSVDGGTP